MYRLTGSGDDWWVANDGTGSVACNLVDPGNSFLDMTLDLDTAKAIATALLIAVADAPIVVDVRDLLRQPGEQPPT